MKKNLIAIVVVVLSNCQTQKTASTNQANEAMGKRDAAHTSQNTIDGMEHIAAYSLAQIARAFKPPSI